MLGDEWQSTGSGEHRSGGLLNLLHTITQVIAHCFFVVSMSAVIIGILVKVIFDKWNPPIVIEPFGAPKAITDDGYTGTVIASKVKDEIRRIDRATKTYAQKHSAILASTESLPEVEIPDTKLSLNTVVNFLETFFHAEPYRIDGELTFGDHDDHQYSSNHQSPNKDARPIVVAVRTTGIDDQSRTVTIAGDLEEAITRAAREVLEIVDPYTLAVYSYRVEKNPAAASQLAAQCYGKAKKWGLILEGNFLNDQRDYDGAILKFQQALELDSRFALAYYNWGFVLAEQQHYDEAIKYYNKAITVGATFPDVYNNLGNLLEKKDYNSAIAEYRNAVKVDPQFALGYYNLGRMLGTRDINDAIAAYEEAIEVDPEFAGAYYNLGLILEKRQDYNGAIANYQKAVRLDPKNNDYRSALERANHSKNAESR